MLDGTVEVRNGPAIVGAMTDTRSILFCFANSNAASSVRSFDST